MSSINLQDTPMVVVEKLANDLYSAFQAMSNVFGEHLSNMALLEIATRLRQNGPESNVISALLLMLKRCPTYLQDRPLPVAPKYPKDGDVREFLATDLTRAAIDLLSGDVPLHHCLAGLIEAVLLLRDQERQLSSRIDLENFGPRIGVQVSFGAGLPKSFVIGELQKLVEALEAGEPAGGLLGDTILIDDPDQSEDDEGAA